ncbi:MAG: hypothetical protein GWO78_00315 [Dehalococcoidales bacterium]|nr:hypothetical protein [Dehalococcoidales bacterium]
MFKISIIIASFTILIISLYSSILISIDFFKENDSNKRDPFIEPPMISRDIRPLDFQRHNEIFQAELELEKEFKERELQYEIEKIDSKIKLLNENNLEFLLKELKSDKKQIENDSFLELKRMDLELKRLEIERSE